eukprot:CAMPEP_0115005944 /NCGR_PEP_ID=MMETSP0216-20121206/20190_1 /TAXON_ID=223996 /ORGANISM="Protocruzia adherens, Strain Boccale" /LENGTH=152 /DNA_ID=CAMNT_0002372401 /DNA_START=35 /DNA_END=493 /DNA_ORIENTATION=-
MASTWKLVVQILTFIIAAGLMVLGVVAMITLDLTQPREYFSNLYFIPFGAMMILAELNAGFVYNWFTFMLPLTGRGLFNIFLATLTFTWDPWYWIIVSIALAFIGIYNIGAGCCWAEKDPRSQDYASSHQKKGPSREASKASSASADSGQKA